MKTLLIVDMQKGFITENNKFLVKNIENLLKKHDFDRIFATKFINNEKSPFVKYLDYTKFFDGDGTDFALDLPSKTVEIKKTSYTLPKILRGGEFYLCGTDYDSCVLAIAFQLFDHGIQPKIILDCVGSHSKNPIPLEDFKKICIKNFGKDSIIENF